MNIRLLSSVAMAATLGFSAAAFAQGGQPVATVHEPATTSARSSLHVDDANIGVGPKMSAVALSDASGLEASLIDANVTSETGDVLATIRDLEYSESGLLAQFIVEDEAGLRYSLPAADVMLHTTIIAVTTTKTIAGLSAHRSALARLGDAIEDAFDGDEAPEDRGVDHTPDANDVDDPEVN
jgi:hypothetical protein